MRRRVTSDNYGRKLKPTAKKTRKTRQKTKKHLKVALLALGVLAIISGMIAGSALTDAKQVPNVGTQVSAAYCAYKSSTGRESFRECMIDLWVPVSVAVIVSNRDIIDSIVRTGVRTARLGGLKGLGVAAL